MIQIMLLQHKHLLLGCIHCLCFSLHWICWHNKNLLYACTLHLSAKYKITLSIYSSLSAAHFSFSDAPFVFHFIKRSALDWRLSSSRECRVSVVVSSGGALDSEPATSLGCRSNKMNICPFPYTSTQRPRWHLDVLFVWQPQTRSCCWGQRQ